MGLYKGSLKVCPIAARWRGFWAVTIKGFPGTIVDCGTQKTIGASGSVTFKFAEAGVYTFIAEYRSETKTETVTLVEGTYFVTVNMYIGYMPLQYVENNKGAMINTEIIPTITQGLSIDMDFILNSIVSSAGTVNGIWGYMYTSQIPRLCFYVLNSRFGYGLNNTTAASVYELGVKYNVKLNNGLLFVNDTQIGDMGIKATNNDSIPIYFGGRGNQNEENSWPSDCRIYGFTITYDGVTKTYKPAKVQEKVGFMIQETGEFVSSCTLTEFIAGPEEK